MKLLILLLFTIIYVVGSPFLVIWSLNNLFKLSIEFSYIKWLSGFALLSVLDMLLNGSKRISKN